MRLTCTAAPHRINMQNILPHATGRRMNQSSFGALVLYTRLTSVSSAIVSAHPVISMSIKPALTTISQCARRAAAIVIYAKNRKLTSPVLSGICNYCALATSTNLAKAAASLTAKSASILRSTITPAFVRPQMKRL